MKVNVLFFGSLSTLGSGKTMEIETNDDLEKLINHLAHQFPALKNYKYRIAINQEVVTGTRELRDGDEIAFLPPFSGG